MGNNDIDKLADNNKIATSGDIGGVLHYLDYTKNTYCVVVPLPFNGSRMINSASCSKVRLSGTDTIYTTSGITAQVYDNCIQVRIGSNDTFKDYLLDWCWCTLSITYKS